jgi:dolichyl-diphosphooligosaccharide--protein glycosyltransferase
MNDVELDVSNVSIYVMTVLMTNQNREIIYKQYTQTNDTGYFNVTVPYSTTGPIDGETQFDTKPVIHYEIRYTENDDLVGLAIVPEKAVLNGETVQMNGEGVTVNRVTDEIK